jgi:hypothetical protein
MSHNRACLSALGVTLLITGCGGSSSSGSAGSGGSGGGNGGAPANQATSITFGFVGGTPTQVAVKIGSGNYTAENLTSGKLTISVPSGTTTYSVAYLCPPYSVGNQTVERESIQFESTQDGNSSYGTCGGGGGATVPPLGTLTGSIDASAFPTAVSAEVEVSSTSYVKQGLAVNGSFQTSGPIGSDRVLMGIYDSSYDHPLAIKNFNNQTVPGALNGGNTVTFTAADATTAQPVSLVNLPAGYGTPFTTVRALNGLFTLATGAVTQYAQLPAGVFQSGDYYSIVSTANLSSGPQPNTIAVFLYPTSGGPVTISFPAPWTTADLTPAGEPTFNFDYTGYAGKSGILSEGGFFWASSADPSQLDEIGVSATQNYLGNVTSLAVPDLSSAGGFLTPPASGTDVSWGETIYQQTYPSSNSLAGGSETYVSVGGSYTVP